MLHKKSVRDPFQGLIVLEMFLHCFEKTRRIPRITGIDALSSGNQNRIPLRILAIYEANTAKINNFWKLWSIILLRILAIDGAPKTPLFYILFDIHINSHDC